MPVMGLWELREHTSEVLRPVREENAEYVVTHQGKPIAVIMPVVSDAVEEAMAEASRANLLGGREAYIRLVSGQQSNPPHPLRRNAALGALSHPFVDSVPRFGATRSRSRAVVPSTMSDSISSTSFWSKRFVEEP